jgi:hypothetical protein
MECEKMKKALALALVISMAFVGSMFAQATPDIGANPEAPGQIGHEEGEMPGAAEGHSGAPGLEGENPGQIGNPGNHNGPKE